jgi:hypothetical protein
MSALLVLSRRAAFAVLATALLAAVALLTAGTTSQHHLGGQTWNKHPGTSVAGQTWNKHSGTVVAGQTWNKIGGRTVSGQTWN